MSERPQAGKRSWFFALLWLCAVPELAASELRDPTRPPGAVSSPAPKTTAVEHRWPVLTATLISPGRRVAILDGQPVMEGAAISGAQLVRVRPGGAVLRLGGREITLELAATEGKVFQRWDNKQR